MEAEAEPEIILHLAAQPIVRKSGNVIGGGDFAQDRIIPDCVRAIKASGSMDAVIEVRNPQSVRPYQHALENRFLRI